MAYGNLIGESDKAPVFVRDVRDVTEHAGRLSAVDLEVRLPIPEAEQDTVKAERVDAILFDLDHETRHDLSGQVESVTPAEPEPEVGRESDDERHGGKGFRVRFKPVSFPESKSLRLVIAMEIGFAEVPGEKRSAAVVEAGHSSVLSEQPRSLPSCVREGGFAWIAVW